MADIRPFRGLSYDYAKTGKLDGLLCPPYDIVTAAQEEKLVRRNQYNAVRLELRERHSDEPADEDRYSQAAELYRQWLEHGVLTAEPSPAMCLVEEEFSHRGSAGCRLGLTVIVRLEEFEKGIVMPHEYTRPGPKADRLALMKACRTNFSPIMSLYRDQDHAIAGVLEQVRQRESDATAAPEGLSSYRMWAITEPDLLEAIRGAMADRQVFVADGHHRYETALQYRNHLEATEGPLPADAAARFMMMTLISMDAPGLLVLPYHRLLSGLSEGEKKSLVSELNRAFRVEVIEIPMVDGNSNAIAETLESRLNDQPEEKVVVMALGLETGRAHLLTLRDSFMPPPGAPSLEKCDMWLLHHHGIRAALGEEREGKAVNFVHDSGEAVESVLRGRADMALLLRPLPMNLFEEVVGKGERLPPKSTYFYPKLPTGLVFNSLSGRL